MRPALVGSPDQRALAAFAELRARIAVVDRNGLVVWVNSSWSRSRQRHAADTIGAAALGVNYIAVVRRSHHPAASAIAEGVRVVLDRSAAFFELEYEASGESGRRTKISVTPAPAGQDGAVVMQIDSTGPTESSSGAAVGPPVSSNAEAPMPLEVLTGREHDVLSLMARGLDNHAIAGELKIGYATVRAHVRSLMAKLGARSRLEAVVRAVQLDLVRVPRTNGAVANERAPE